MGVFSFTGSAGPLEEILLCVCCAWLMPC